MWSLVFMLTNLVKHHGWLLLQGTAGKAAKQKRGGQATPVQAPASSAPKQAAGKPASGGPKLKATKQRASSTAQPGGAQAPGGSAPEQAAGGPASKAAAQAEKLGARSRADYKPRKRKEGSAPQEEAAAAQGADMGADMPSIPGADMPRGWHDKRTDVKTGYFSQQERQAIRDGAEVRVLPATAARACLMLFLVFHLRIIRSHKLTCLPSCERM